LNLKSKRQGFGNYQFSEQIRSEVEIEEFLMWLLERTKKFDEKSGYEKNYWASIREICRRTRLHHNTVKKAIERLKNKYNILEVHGTHNSRLFCFSDSPNADYIRSKIKQDPSLADFYRKFNSDDYMKKILIHPKFDEDGLLVLPKQKKEPTYNRLRKKPDFLEDRFAEVMKKRKTISRKNRKVYDSKS